jgi:hypothetical protein
MRGPVVGPARNAQFIGLAEWKIFTFNVYNSIYLILYLYKSPANVGIRSHSLRILVWAQHQAITVIGT